MPNTIANEDFYRFCDLRQNIMKHKSVSFYEATIIAGHFFVRGIEPRSGEFDEAMKDVKTLWED